MNIKDSSGADALLRVLRAQGVERIYASPGSDWAPLWESLAKSWAPGAVPEYISSRHEETAVGMAIGYAKVTGKLPALVIHTTVGALHAAMGLRAALHERVPMVVLAGESVSFAEPGAPPAGRQWLRVLTDLGGPARLAAPSVKWSFGLNSSLLLPHTMQRACQIALTAPKGPVFVSVPTEFLMEAMQAEPPPVAALPVAPGPDAAAIAAVARELAAAKNPVIVAEEIGRNLRAVEQLVRLAELLGAPVLEGWHADTVNFPRAHPLFAGTAVEPVNEVVKDADFVLLAEAIAPWHPPAALRGAKVAALGEDPLQTPLPHWGYRADFVVPGDIEMSLGALAKEIEALVRPGSRKEAVERWRARNEKHRADLHAKASAQGAGAAITAAWAARELNELLPPDAIVVNETISHRGDLVQLLECLEPGGLFDAHYGGLGMGLGVALGVKHAQPKRPVVLTIGDGSFGYNPVVAAFGGCQELDLPLLVVLFDNAGYFSQKADVVREYPQGAAVRSGKFIGTSIVPRPDYVLLARAFGGDGSRVEKPGELREALRKGFETVAQGRLALVHVILEPVNPGDHARR